MSSRTALYMATWSAVRAPGKLRSFYQALLEAGKTKQVALIAVARKLLVALNEMVRTGQTWKSPIEVLPAAGAARR